MDGKTGWHIVLFSPASLSTCRKQGGNTYLDGRGGPIHKLAVWLTLLIRELNYTKFTKNLY
jgi:hypothetical protein